jgi:hypothetical protein
MFESKSVNVVLFLVGGALIELVHVKGVPFLDQWGPWLVTMGGAMVFASNVKRILPGKK